MKIRGKRRRNASVIARPRRRPGGTIEISASRWSPVINRIVSDPLGQPPANRYLDRSKAAPTCKFGENHGRKGSLAPFLSLCHAPPACCPPPSLAPFFLPNPPHTGLSNTKGALRPVRMSPRGCLPVHFFFLFFLRNLALDEIDLLHVRRISDGIYNCELFAIFIIDKDIINSNLTHWSAPLDF